MYLKLEHHRFKDKFEYSFKVDEGINTEDFFNSAYVNTAIH